METIKSQYHDHSGRIGFDGLSKSAYKFIETIIGLTGKTVSNIQLDDTLYVVLTWVKYFQIDVYTQITDK